MKKILVFGSIAVIISIAGLALSKTKRTMIQIQAPANNYEASLEAATTTTTSTAVAAPAETAPPPQIKLLPGNQVRQGGTLRVILQHFSSKPALNFGNKNYGLFNYDGAWNALIPIAAEAATGPIVFAVGSTTENVTITPGHFQNVAINLPQLITTPQEAAAYQEEKKNILAAYDSSAPDIYFQKPFGFPLANVTVTNPFGVTYVDAAHDYKTFHNGVDLKADVGTSVKAVNDGMVKIASNYLLEGTFVMIDHGHGVFSDYLHLSKILVKPGEKVAKGQVIGLSGESGEAVGPHLHFMIKINDVPVDPLAFINLWQ